MHGIKASVMFKSSMLLSSLLLISSPVVAQTAVPSTAASATAKSKDPNRIICEKQEELGTRLGGKKVCKTAAEWDEERRLQRENLEGVQRQATSTGAPSGM
jgi:hypothetical protein